MQPGSAHDRFWDWFRGNGPRLRGMMYGTDESAREAASDELRAAVERVEPGVILEFGQRGEGRPDQLVVSADGHPERADAVKDLVASAPDLPGWEVVAFRPRMETGDGIAIVIQDERVAPDDVRFQIEPDTEGLVLTLFVRGLTEANRRFRGLGASLLAQHAIGERDTLALINALQVEPLKQQADARPFGELLAVIAAARDERFPPPGALIIDKENGWLNLSGTLRDAPALMLLHAGLRAVAGHPSYDRRLTVSLPYAADENGLPATPEEYTAVAELGDRVSDALEAGQQSLLALTVMTQGRRDLVFYTSDAAGALARLAPWPGGPGGRAVEPGVEFDSFWGMYRSFLDAAEGAEPEEEE